jgi:hypothetical protein
MRWRCGAAALLLALALASGAGADGRALRDLEGTVVEVGSGTAEADLEVVTVSLDVGEAVPFEVALAPASVLDETGFGVAVGDRLRARVFVAGDGAAAGGAATAAPTMVAQKVMNLSRNLLLRLRTFNRQPIWDAEGRWQGSGAATGETTRGRPTRPTRRRPPARRPPSRDGGGLRLGPVTGQPAG